jgi:hypothetical protein
MSEYKEYLQPKELFAIHKIEEELFQTEDFNLQTALFPNYVFRKFFNYLVFLPFNDWFSESAEFKKLIKFTQEIEEKSFIMSCPPFYKICPIEFLEHCLHRTFLQTRSHLSEEFSRFHTKGVGFLISPEVFMFSKGQTWAMVHDITNDLIIVGLDESVKSHFKSIFGSEVFSINGALGNPEKPQDQAITEIITRYTTPYTF